MAMKKWMIVLISYVALDGFHFIIADESPFVPPLGKKYSLGVPYALAMDILDNKL